LRKIISIIDGNYFPPAGLEGELKGTSDIKPFVPKRYGDGKIIADREVT
jgi:hypothetical protein